MALFGSTTKTARVPITATQDNKAMRGTKRVCHACEVPFYDLLRDPIVCPSCGVQHVPAAPHMVEVGTRVAPVAGKTGWRGKGGFKRPDPEPDVAPEVAATEDSSEQAIGATPNEDVLLEQEPDEEDVTSLVGPRGGTEGELK